MLLEALEPDTVLGVTSSPRQRVVGTGAELDLALGPSCARGARSSSAACSEHQVGRYGGEVVEEDAVLRVWFGFVIV